jgi:hypothetical protein
MVAEQHRHAADHLDRIADEHDVAFGESVGERAEPGRQDHIEQREDRHQCGPLPFGAATALDQLHCRHEKRLVGQ